MLSSVLNSERAIQVNIQIMRVYTKIKEMLLNHKDILLQLEKLEKDVTENKQDIKVIFTYLKQLLNPPQLPRKRIGYIRSDEQD